MEKLQKQILELQDQLKAKEDMIQNQNELLEGFKAKENSYNEKISNYQEQVMRLRDMNTDLFLRVSQPVEPAVVVEEEKPSQESTISLEDILG